jgi:hypothetical protein
MTINSTDRFIDFDLLHSLDFYSSPISRFSNALNMLLRGRHWAAELMR